MCLEMTGTLENKTTTAVRLVAPAGPYLAVLAGLHLAGSAVIAVVGYHLGICLILTVARRWSLLEEVRRGFALVPALLFGPVCLSAAAAIYLLWPVASTEGVTMSGQLARLGLDPTWWPPVVVYSLVVNPVLEEIYWRGFLGSDRKGPAVSDLLFAGYHALVLALFVRWPFVVAGTITLVAAGWFWRTLRRRYEGLAIPVLGHLLADAGILIAVALIL